LVTSLILEKDSAMIGKMKAISKEKNRKNISYGIKKNPYGKMYP